VVVVGGGAGGGLLGGVGRSGRGVKGVELGVGEGEGVQCC
jgi:hypothetical protein